MQAPVEHCKPDIVWETPDEINIIEVGVPLDKNVIATEEEQKEQRYTDLKRYMARAFKKPTRVTTVVIGHTGVITKRGVENIKSLDCDIQVHWLQKMVTNETANIVTELIRGKEIANPQQ